jgi:hypothetical protein
MRTMKLVSVPKFPAEFNRRAETREEWIKAGKSAFWVMCNGKRHGFQMKSKPIEVRTGSKELLRVDAALVTPLAEVWDSTNRPCRVWFSFDGKTYEAGRLDGWKPRAVPMPSFKSQGCSLDATKSALTAAGQV